MHFPPRRLEARVALEDERRDEHNLPRQLIGGESTVDPLQSWLSEIFGPDPTSTSTRTTRTSTRTTATPTATTRQLTTQPVITTPSTTRTTSRTSTPLTTAQVITSPPPSVNTRTSFSTVTSTSTNIGNTDASQANSSSAKSGLPSVVIGVIVAASIIFGLIFLALIARKIFQSRRRSRRATWARNSTVAPFEPTIQEKALPPPPPMEVQQNYATYPAYPPAAMSYANNNPTPYSPAAASSAGYPAPYPFAANLAGNTQGAPNNGNGVFNSTSYSPADLAGPVVIQHTPPTPSTATTNVASAPISVVKRTFVPSLPDELSISTGEQVRVLSVYDDGWALCEKLGGGEKGVVPQECLDKLPQANSNTPQQQIASTEDTRLNRNSSLRRNQEQSY